MSSLRANFIRFFVRQYFRRVTPDRDVNDVRANFEDFASRLRAPNGVRVRHSEVAGVDCDWLVPEGLDDAPVIFYLHGGAYIMGSSRTHRRLAANIAIASGCRALLPNYRLAPEHPFPAGLDDACRVYRELLKQGEEPERIVFGGDSAGGGLATGALIALRDAGDPLPAAAVLLSPWLDLTGSGKSMSSREGIDPMFRPDEMPAVADFYCKEEERSDPRVSPVLGDVSGLPPLFIQVGDQEILLSDATRLSDKVSDTGGKVTLQIWPDMWHVFQFLAGQVPEAKRAIDDIGRYVRRVFADTQSPD